MRIIKRIIMGFFLLNVAVGLVARFVVKPRLPSFGGPEDDSFRVSAITDGAEFKSRAASLHSGEVIAGMGGVQLDLREATLSDGARLRIAAVMGGVQVLVPEDWKIHTTTRLYAGGVDTKTTPSDHLPPENPTLMVDILCVMGGVEIKAK